MDRRCAWGAHRGAILVVDAGGCSGGGRSGSHRDQCERNHGRRNDSGWRAEIGRWCQCVRLHVRVLSRVLAVAVAPVVVGDGVTALDHLRVDVDAVHFDVTKETPVLVGVITGTGDQGDVLPADQLRDPGRRSLVSALPALGSVDADQPDGGAIRHRDGVAVDDLGRQQDRCSDSRCNRCRRNGGRRRGGRRRCGRRIVVDGGAVDGAVVSSTAATTAGVAAFGLAAPVGETHRDDASATRVVHP